MTVPLAATPRSTIDAPARRSGTGITDTGTTGTGTARTRSAAVQRAYARRARRTGALRPAPLGAARQRPVPGRSARRGTVRTDVATASRTPFAVLVMVLLLVTLVATLWLSIAAAADSYRLQSAREETRDLTERSEQLGREVATMETAPELARRAVKLGMVPAGDPARLKVAPDGTVVLVGEPQPATAPPANQVGSAAAPLPGRTLPAPAHGG